RKVCGGRCSAAGCLGAPPCSCHLLTLVSNSSRRWDVPSGSATGDDIRVTWPARCRADAARPAPASRHRGHVLGWDRLPEEVTLTLVALEAAKQRVLCSRLDALRCDPQSQALADADDRPYQVDVGARSPVADLRHEAPVDLQAIERQLPQVR